MAGITSYGAYIPWYRMNRKVIFDQMGWFNAATAGVARGEKAVANHDEDTISMACSASIDCLSGQSREDLDGLYLASTSLPFAQRQNAIVIADALDLRPNVRTADFAGSLKAGTAALLAALDAVVSGSGSSWMVVAGECRVGKPGSAQEHTFGDGAGALMVGTKNVIAEFKGAFSVSYDFLDYRRLAEERFVHPWEDRWIREEGYGKIIPEAASGLLKKYNLKMSDFAKVIIPCPMTGWIKGFAKAIGARDEQVEDNLQATVGDTGTALPLMMLVAALEKAKAGDRILLLSYGNGSDALWFEVTPEIEKARGRKAIQGHLVKRNDFKTYGKYLVFRDLLPLEVGIRGETIPPTAMSVLWQQGRTVSALVGVRCKACGTPQYPKHIVCVNPKCEAVSQMEPYRFSDKTGKVISFTGDNLAFSWDPPSIYGLVDFEGGGRLFMDFTDCRIEDVTVGLPVELTFRRKYSDKQRGYYGYYWKVMPAER
ncbi:MAG: OB-fold domain-containing protein [Syntrophales bacterium LBB04]|nr:OB-fold domain-containing protein [Syntrophales bacterium LBB04]